MQQYIDLLKTIRERGTNKPAARAGMPGSRSLFGYQFRHNLADGFPLLTTKSINFHNVVVELLWFLRGDTNIKYLLYHGVNIWNEDAYNYYVKIASANTGSDANSIYFNNGDGTLRMFTFEEFIEVIRQCEYLNSNYDIIKLPKYGNYTLGDCGFQYGKVWRGWELQKQEVIRTGAQYPSGEFIATYKYKTIDQIKRLIKSLKETPESRRHIVTAIDPAHDQDLALYWCHAMFQFNCRPIEYFYGDGLAFGERDHLYRWITKPNEDCSNDFDFIEIAKSREEAIEKMQSYPTYYLDCQLYQRSADVVLGVPYNIASYALLTHILAKICNMVPGEFIHSFGDVHIYDNHNEAVNTQLERKKRSLPTLVYQKSFNNKLSTLNLTKCLGSDDLNHLINSLEPSDFALHNYDPHPPIKAKLSTGLK